MTGRAAAPPAPTALTAADRCDRCGAAASIRAVLASGGELMFCGHHGRQHLPRLEQLAAVIHESRKVTTSL